MDTITFKNKLNEIAELGWKETKTTSYIMDQLEVHPLKKGFGKGETGLLYKIGTGTRCILLRADIDALKTAHGVAHTCGHSTHMASLMTVFCYASQLSERLTKDNKSIYFLFQPAEETYPSGGHAFMKECPHIISKIESAFAIHVRPTMKLGTIGLQSGPIWARGDYMEIEILGKMVHIKNGQDGIDAIYASSLLVAAIKKIQNRFKSIRIGIGVIEGGRQANTIADRCLLKGDIRLPHQKWQSRIKKMISVEIERVEKQTGARIKLNYFDGTPPVINEPKLTKSITTFLKSQLNTTFNIQSKDLFSYGCEDFAYIAEKIPSTVALIGTGDVHDLHEENCTISDQGTIKAYQYFKAVVDWFMQS